MIPTKFQESNSVLTGGGDPNILDLHTYKDGEHIISCWTGTWRERLRFLVTGKMWVWIFAPKTQPPILLDTVHPFKKP